MSKHPLRVYYLAAAELAIETRNSQLAALLPGWAVQDGCPLPGDIITKLLATQPAKQPRFGITPYRKDGGIINMSDKRVFAYLNPLLLPSDKIDDAAGSGKSKHWVATYRTQLRASQARTHSRTGTNSTVLPHPIDPDTALYYCEHPDKVAAHLDTYLYLYHAQAWALRIYAARWQKMHGDTVPCVYCNMTAPQMRERAAQPAPFLGMMHLREQFPRGLTLTAPGRRQSMFFSNAHLEEYCLQEAGKLNKNMADFYRANRDYLPKRPMRTAAIPAQVQDDLYNATIAKLMEE